MCTSALWLVCVSLLFGTSLSCFQCFVDLRDSYRLCWGHFLTSGHNIRNMDSCFRKVDRIFNNNKRVIEAGRVGMENIFFNNIIQSLRKVHLNALELLVSSR